MPLLICQIPACSNQLLSAKLRFEGYYKLSRCPLEKYVLYEEARLMYHKKDFFQNLVRKKNFYGFKLKNEEQVYIHPDTYHAYLIKYFKQINVKSRKEDNPEIN